MAFIPYPPPERPPDDEMDDKTREFWRLSERARAFEYAWTIATFIVPFALILTGGLVLKACS